MKSYDAVSTMDHIQTTEWKENTETGEKCLQAYLTIVAVDTQGKEHIGQFFAGVEISVNLLSLPNIKEIKERRKREAVLDLFLMVIGKIDKPVRFPPEQSFIMAGFLPYKNQPPGATAKKLGLTE